MDPPRLQAVIFDLDGVIVSTDELHYLGWQALADEEAIEFNRNINHRLRGVSRMESLEILLEKSTRTYTPAERAALAARKNATYNKLLERLTPADILPGALELCRALREQGVKLAIGSSSRNSPTILKQIGLADFFDATADGNDISKSKPDPEVFLLAAKRLGVQPARSIVVEDAETGVTAALAGGFKCLAVGSAQDDKRAHLRAADLRAVSPQALISACG